MLNVIRSVTRNGRSIILTAVLALILVYLFSIIGYIFFKDDFLVPVDDEVVDEGNWISNSVFFVHINESLIIHIAASVLRNHMTGGGEADQCTSAEASTVASGGGDRKERACDSLVMCILTTLNQGLRNGGGIGDILRAPSSTVCG